MFYDPIADHARAVAAAQSRAAALSCIARLEADVNEARAEAHRARVELHRARFALARIRRDAKRGATCAIDPFARLICGSIAVIAEDAVDQG